MRIDLTRSPLLAAFRRDPSPMLEAAVMQRDGYTCRYCPAPAKEIDHVQPWSKGGLTTFDNLVAACQRCNREKGDRTPAEWEAAKQRQAALEIALRKRALKMRKRPLVKVKRIPGHRPTPSLAELLRAR